MSRATWEQSARHRPNLGERRSTGRQLLDAREIERLDSVYLDIYEQFIVTREREPLAQHLHLPKLPEILSLSIAVLAGEALIGASLSPAPFPDDLHHALGRRIAVKGTGPSSWIAVTDTDRASDVLIWVDYRERVLSGGRVQVMALCAREYLCSAPKRLTLAQLLKACGHRISRADFDPCSASNI